MPDGALIFDVNNSKFHKFKQVSTLKTLLHCEFHSETQLSVDIYKLYELTVDLEQLFNECCQLASKLKAAQDSFAIIYTLEECSQCLEVKTLYVVHCAFDPDSQVLFFFGQLNCYCPITKLTPHKVISCVVNKEGSTIPCPCLQCDCEGIAVIYNPIDNNVICWDCAEKHDLKQHIINADFDA